MTKPRSKYKSVRHVLDVARLVWGSQKAGRSVFYALVGCNLVSTLLPYTQIWLTAAIVDQMVRGSASVTGSTVDRKFLWLLLGLAACTLTAHVVGRLLIALSDSFYTASRHAIQELIAEKAGSLDVSYFEDPEFHDLIQRAGDSGLRPVGLMLKAIQGLSGTVGVLLVATIVFKWSGWLLVTLAMPPVVGFWLGLRISAERVKAGIAKTRLERKAAYLRLLFFGDGPAKELRVLRLQNYILKRLRDLGRQISAGDNALSKSDFLNTGVLGAVLALNIPLIVSYFALQCYSAQITIGQFVFLSQAAITFSTAVGKVLGNCRDIFENALFVSSVVEFVQLKPSVEARTTDPKTEISNHPILEFRNVSFRYPNADATILHDLSFRVDRGEIVAVVGENGSGKSTIIKLVCGLYEPSTGSVHMDNVDFRRLSRHDIRSRVGVVLQDVTIYHMTMRENIAIGVNDPDQLCIADVQAAARLAGLEHIVAALPRGYDTILSRQYENGHELSGGQRQLVAQARAFARTAPVLVLDEPTSALDRLNETRFASTLIKMARQKQQSVLIISHRLSTVRQADRIIVLSKGRIVECGSHAHLARIQGGEYARLWASQEEQNRMHLTVAK